MTCWHFPDQNMPRKRIREELDLGAIRSNVGVGIKPANQQEKVTYIGAVAGYNKTRGANEP